MNFLPGERVQTMVLEVRGPSGVSKAHRSETSYAFLVMTSVILSGGMKMRDEHGMLMEVYICL